MLVSKAWVQVKPILPPLLCVMGALIIISCKLIWSILLAPWCRFQAGRAFRNVPILHRKLLSHADHCRRDHSSIPKTIQTTHPHSQEWLRYYISEESIWLAYFAKSCSFNGTPGEDDSYSSRPQRVEKHSSNYVCIMWRNQYRLIHGLYWSRLLGLNALLVFIPISVCCFTSKLGSPDVPWQWAINFALPDHHTLIFICKYTSRSSFQPTSHFASVTYLAIIPLARVNWVHFQIVHVWCAHSFLPLPLTSFPCESVKLSPVSSMLH